MPSPSLFLSLVGVQYNVECENPRATIGLVLRELERGQKEKDEIIKHSGVNYSGRELYSVFSAPSLSPSLLPSFPLCSNKIEEDVRRKN